MAEPTESTAPAVPEPQAAPAPADFDAFLGVRPVVWWRHWLKWLALGMIVVVAIVLLLRYFGAAPVSQYISQPVRRGALQVTVSATGRLAPVNQILVGSELSGLVTKVMVDVNYPVTAGQPLALIDPSRFADTVHQSKAQLLANQGAVALAQATLVQDSAQLARQEQVFRISGGKVPSDTDLATARAEFGRAKAALASAVANVAAARAVVSSDSTILTKTVIRSPVKGVVLTRQIEPGQTVASSFNTPTLFVIAQDLAQMKLPVAVDEADVGEVAEGQQATFTVDAFPGERFPATISRVDLGSNLTATSATPATATSTTNSQVVSYNANLTVANATLRLRPGMTATATIITRARPDVLLVPNAALRYKPADASATASGFASAIIPGRSRRGNQQGQIAARGKGARQTVYVIDNGISKALEIQTGVTDGTMTEVTGGPLRPGMQVITGQLASGGH